MKSSQGVLYEGYFVHTLFEHIIDLYYDVGEGFPQNLLTIYHHIGHTGLLPLVNVIEKGSKSLVFSRYADKYYQALNVPKSNNVLVCFSGGKDSTAVAIKLRAEGKNVSLYFLKGINKSYGDEYLRAENVAKLLGLPLFVEEVKLVGKSRYKENPVKNQIIATFALNYAIKNNLGCAVAFGDFKEDTIADAVFDRNWSDTQEMWKAYEEVIKAVVPNFEVFTPFNNYCETLYLIAQDRKLLEAVQGCLAPQRFRKHWHDMNVKKFGYELLPNRCGSCWKCCVEYIFLVDNGFLESNADFYKHCFKLLCDKLPEEHPNKECYTIGGVRDVYFPKFDKALV